MESRQELPPEVTPPEALLITGDGMKNVTLERIEAIARLLGGLGLKVEVVYGLEQLRRAPEKKEEAPEPIIVTREDFWELGVEEKGNRSLAGRVWNNIARTARDRKYQGDGFPPIKFVDELVDELSGSTEPKSLDLRSVAARFKKSRGVEGAWYGDTPDCMKFIRKILDKYDLLEEDENQPS